MSPSESDIPPAEQKGRSPAAVILDGLPYVLLGLLLLAFSIRQIATLDIWWHLASGRWIWNHGQIPDVDVFTHTIEGQPWIDVWWAFQIPAFLLHEWFGFGGLIILKTAFIAGAFGICFLTVPRESRGSALILLGFFAILISQLRFHARPTAVTFLFTALYLFILDRHSRTKTRWLWALPGFHFVWANLHGVATVGIVMILTFAFAELWKNFAPLPWDWDAGDKGDRNRCKRLSAAAGLCLFASALNPYGLRGVAYAWGQVFWVMTDVHPIAQLLSEHWSPFSEKMAFHPYTRLSYFAFTFLTALSFIINWRRLRLVSLLLYLGFLALFVSAMRNSVLFALVATPLAAENYGLWFQHLRNSGKLKATTVSVSVLKATIAVVLFAAVFDVVSGRFYRRDRGDFEVGLGVQSGLFPEGTAGFLAQNRFDGKLFNDSDFGGYLSWRLFPPLKVFIDPRNFVFGEFGKAYALSRGNPDAFFRLVDRYEVTHALIRHTDPANRPLLKRLASRPKWRFERCDDVSALFVSKPITLSGYEPRSEKPKSDQSKIIGPYERYLKKPSRVNLWRHTRAMVSIARLFRHIGRHDVAADILERALPERWFDEKTLRGEEVYSPVYFEMGVQLLELGDPGNAAQYLEKAQEWDERSLERLFSLPAYRVRNYEKLGLARQQSNLLKKAEDAYQKAVATGLASARTYYDLGTLQLLSQNGQAAVKNLEQAIRLAPDYAPAYANLGFALIQTKQPLEAVAQCRKALELDPDLVPALNMLGRLMMQQENQDEARKLWKRSLKIEPAQKKVNIWLEGLR